MFRRDYRVYNDEKYFLELLWQCALRWGFHQDTSKAGPRLK